MLAVFIKGVKEKAKAFRSEISERIRNVYSVIMGNSYDLEEDEKPQIKLLECTPLEFVDILRMLGYGVRQVF